MRGRKKTPTKILAMRGAWRAKTRTEEPDPPPLTARAPAWLDTEGKKLWKAWTKRLQVCGILTTVDEVTFARYCQILARWIKMEQFIQKYGEVYPQRDLAGNITAFAIFPQVGLYLRLSDQLIKLEQQFGLTPASRASLTKQTETPPHGNSGAHPGKKDPSRFFVAG